MVYRAQSASTEAAQILKSLMVEICAFRADAYLSAFCSSYIVPFSMLLSQASGFGCHHILEFSGEIRTSTYRPATRK